MADNVGDRVRLTRAWRALDDDAVRSLQSADYLDLLVVEGLWKEQVRFGRGVNVRLGGTLIRLADPRA
jgi:hypothetical protein